jgi:hypothetical protein
VTRLALPLTFALLALTLIGCGPPWKLIRASGPPSALAPMTSLGVSFDYSALIMGGMPEQQWLMSQPPDDQASYLEVRGSMEAQLIMELTAQLAREGIAVQPASGGESHQLVIRFTRIEMGFYRFMVNLDSTLDTSLAFGPTGSITDEIEVHTTREANLRNASIRERMDYCAARTAQLAAEYVRRARNP